MDKLRNLISTDDLNAMPSRDQRLRAALRANLRRRKGQAAQRGETEGDGDPAAGVVYSGHVARGSKADS